MSQKVSLDLPDSVMERAGDAAERAGIPVEDVLTQWLKWMAVAQHRGDYTPDVEYPIYTPYGNEAAAKILQDMLKARKTNDTSEQNL